MTTTLKSNDPCWCGSGRKYKRCHRPADGGRPTAAQRVVAGAESILASPSARPVVRGRLSPRRPVPSGIAAPDYVVLGRPLDVDVPLIKDEDQIARMRAASRAAAEVLALTGAAVAPGITTDQLDAIAHDATLERGAYPSPLGYHGYPKSICTSVNEVICHGIPDSRPLEDGDIVNIDVTVFLDGMHGDTNATFLVGDVDEPSRRLVEVTRECLDLGIAAVRPGRQVRAIGQAIQRHAEGHGFGVVRAFVGHGIGELFHMAPQVPHFDDARATMLIEPGMTFTIEPMITMGAWQHRMWDDDWTAVTADLQRTAQFEHTILVTDEGAEVLTVP